MILSFCFECKIGNYQNTIKGHEVIPINCTSIDLFYQIFGSVMILLQAIVTQH